MTPRKLCKKLLGRHWEQLRIASRKTTLVHVRNVLGTLKEQIAKSKGKVLPGFCLPKGLTPILPLFLNSLISGSPDTRKQAASGLGDLISLTSDEALKPFVIQITGWWKKKKAFFFLSLD